jgi:hypothetical protein
MYQILYQLIEYLFYTFVVCFSWCYLIDYTKFYVAGGCLVTCLMENAVLSAGQDVDLFYLECSYDDYLKSVVRCILFDILYKLIFRILE